MYNWYIAPLYRVDFFFNHNSVVSDLEFYNYSFIYLSVFLFRGGEAYPDGSYWYFLLLSW